LIERKDIALRAAGLLRAPVDLVRSLAYVRSAKKGKGVATTKEFPELVPGIHVAGITVVERFCFYVSPFL